MKTTLEKTEELISFITKNKNYNNLSKNIGKKNEISNFYFRISGFFNKYYFSIYIYTSIINGLETIKVANTTECKEEITKLLNKFELYEN